jgi:predicted ArsR family transcriptional regulator
VLSNCPFDTVARAHTQLICGMDLAMLAAVIEQLQETALAAGSNPQQTDAVSSRCQLMPRTVGAAVAYPRDQLGRVGEAW